MQESNPYQAPVADVSVNADVPLVLQEPVSNPFGQGWSWITEAFSLFKQGAGVWIGMFIVYLLIILVGSVIPFVNMLIGLITPLFTAGFMVACYNGDTKGNIQFIDLFAGFKRQFGNLVLLCLLYLLLSLAILAVMGLLIFIVAGSEQLSAFSAISSNSATPEDVQLFMANFLLIMLVGMALWVPLMMAFWFAPALVVLNEQGPWTAVVLSFKGCLKNILPFLLYGIVLTVFAILATIPLALGWLVLGPVITLSMYTAYKKIFLAV